MYEYSYFKNDETQMSSLPSPSRIFKPDLEQEVGGDQYGFVS